MGKGDLEGGRPRREIDLETLQTLVRMQCTAAECASVLGVSVDTLSRRIWEIKDDETGAPIEGFADYYKKESPFGRASLRRMMWTNAKNGNPGMQIFLSKQPPEKGGLGMTDRYDYAFGGLDDGPVPMVDWSKVSTDTLLEIQGLLASAGADSE